MTRQEIKAAQKELALKIRTTRKHLRTSGYLPTWRETLALRILVSDFRHRHVAYCMLRGRTIEQIESSPNGTRPDMARVQALIEEWTRGA